MCKNEKGHQHFWTSTQRHYNVADQCTSLHSWLKYQLHAKWNGEGAGRSPSFQGREFKAFSRLSKGSGNTKNNFTDFLHNPKQFIITSKWGNGDSTNLKSFPKVNFYFPSKIKACENASYSGSKVPAFPPMLKNDNIRWRNCYSINIAKSNLMTMTYNNNNNNNSEHLLTLTLY